MIQTMTREEILSESAATDYVPVASYPVTFDSVDADGKFIEETATVRIIPVGSDQIGWTLLTRDNADGPRDDAGTDVYPTLGAAIRAAFDYAESQGGEREDLIGIYAEAYEA